MGLVGVPFIKANREMMMRKLLLASAATLLAGGVAFAQPVTQAAPGKTSVYMQGFFTFGYGVYGQSKGMSGGSGSTAYKLNDNGMFGDIHIMPGFDGQTLNGILYGFRLELRDAVYNAGRGKNNNTTTDQGTGSMYVQRAYGYIGTKDDGFVRFGQTDSAFTLSQTGVLENFGDHEQFNCDNTACVMPAIDPANFIYADSSHLYSTSKVVYISPAFDALGGKVSGIVGFEPNSNGIKEGYASAASINGANVNSLAGGSSSRRRNTVDVSATYETEIDGFANKLSAGYLHGSPLGNLTGPQGYKEMSVYQVGAQTTYAGLTVGGNIKGGQVNGGYDFNPEGGRSAFGYIVGAVYNVGPYTIGTSYFNEQSSGAWTAGGTTARTLSEYGVNVGGDYQLAKPVTLYVEYGYGHQHQPEVGVATNSQVQYVSTGVFMSW